MKTTANGILILVGEAVIPKAAHCSCVEAAEAFNRALLGFLARVR